jgi:hypothetical protein
VVVLALYVAVAAAPAVAMVALERALRWWCQGGGGRSTAPAGRSLEQLAADLRRLDAEQRTLTCTGAPVPGVRMRAVSLAYDDTLVACCRAVGVSEPPTPLTTLDRLQTEAELAMHGLSW